MQAGVSSGRAQASDTVWNKWEEFCLHLALDPFLQTFTDKVPILQVFGQGVREGTFAARGDPVRARTAEDYLRSVAQTFRGMGSTDPRVDVHNDIDFRLSRMISAWKREDPPPNRVKPIPIQIIRRIALLASTATDDLTKATADMIIIAFFFLMRPGEYTDTSSEDACPFKLEDVQLFIGQRRIDLATASDDLIRQATFASLTFTWQKNGVRGEVIGLALSGDPYLCPVKAIIRRVLYLRSKNLALDVPLARVQGRAKVTSKQITETLRDAVVFFGTSLGFTKEDISARSLRAAGANALLFAKVDTDIIRLIGRWKSDEMLRYLHVQAAPLMADYSRRMVESGTYTLIPGQSVPMH